MKRKLVPSAAVAAEEATPWQSAWTQLGVGFLTNVHKSDGMVRLRPLFLEGPGVTIYGYSDERGRK